MPTPLKNMVYPERPVMFTMAATPLDDQERVDEKAVASHLTRLADAGCGAYIGSAGTGDGSALDPDELQQLYQTAVKTLKGKVPVYANPREAHTAKQMLRVAKLAVDAGVDVVQLYQSQALHANQVDPRELDGFYRYLLTRIDHPVALSIHSASGYLAPVELTIKLVNEFKHVVAVNLHGPSTAYFVRLRRDVRPEVKLYGGANTLPMWLPLGGWGAQAHEPNYVPHLSQSVLDHYAAGDMKKYGEAYALLTRVMDGLATPGQAGSVSRLVKNALKALGLPGGPPKSPFMLGDDATIERMRKHFKALDIPELRSLPAMQRP